MTQVGTSGQSRATSFSAKVTSTEQIVEKADFSDVTARVESTEEIVGQQTYTIEKGDTLSKIAKQHFGNANAWKQIFEANRDTLDDPDRIFPGQVIKLPPKPADA